MNTTHLLKTDKTHRDFLMVDGVKLEIESYAGKKAKVPTLVLLHEGLGCVAMWKDFPKKLAVLTGYPIFLYSRQGYGLSDSWDEPLTNNYMHHEGLEILPRVLESAGIDEYILIGHSDGGSISLIHAGGNAGLGLVAVITMAAHVFCEIKTIDSIAKVQQSYPLGEIKEGFSKYHFDKTDNLFWEWSKTWLQPDFMDWNIEKYLPRVKVPQLVIQGKNDQFGTLKQVSAIKNQSCGSVDTALLDDCGHSAYKEQPLATLQHINHFLKSLEQRMGNSND